MPVQSAPQLHEPPAYLQRLCTKLEAADRKVRAGAPAVADEEAHRDNVWEEMATLERQERAGFAWYDDEGAWVTDAAKEKRWTILKDPGEIRCQELERFHSAVL